MIIKILLYVLEAADIEYPYFIVSMEITYCDNAIKESIDVGMMVSDQEGARRENSRGSANAHDILEDSRMGGWNRTSAIMTHKDMIYDFEIDNTNLSIERLQDKFKWLMKMLVILWRLKSFMRVLRAEASLAN